MNGLTAILTAFCASSVILGGLYMLCPDGNLSKSVKYILGLAFLLSVIGASGITVKNADISFSAPKVTPADSEALEASSARYVYAYCLQKAGIDFSEITVYTDKSEDSSIIINKVIIRSDCEEDKIRVALGEAAINLEVEIINE